MSEKQSQPETPEPDLLKTDPEAFFHNAVERYKRPVIAFAYRFCGSRETAEDIAQEVFLKAWKALGSYKPRAKFSTWLFTIASNTCINRQRADRLRRFVSLFYPSKDPNEHEELLPLPELRESGPAELAEKEETVKRVQAALLTLPERQRIAVLLSRFENLSLEEIAGIMDCSVGTVKQLLFRARTALKKNLKK